MRYPEFLKDNGIIGFTAPSFGCATQPYRTGFERAMDKLTARGYGLDIGDNCYSSNGIGISDKPEVCASELEKMYMSRANDVLISCGGGELMCEILEFLDFDALKAAKPKWFMGYSDNTNFTFLQNTICDTASVYAPCAATYGMNKWDMALEDTFAALTGKKTFFEGYDMWERESLKTEDNPTPEYNLTEKKLLVNYVGSRRVSSYEQISFKGRLTGGCMDCLVNLLGTKFDYAEEFNDRYAKDGVIWFLESCDLNVFAMRRAMWQMDKAGWFKNASGFIIGRPYAYGQEIMGLNQYDAVMGIIGKYNVPVIMDADFGHLPPAVPIISGSTANISSKDNNWSVEYTFR
ncbi:MAG: LD-carboxypeptidase [Eubacteriales bacterium]|nr:LD-carboxypeptidase [Eubacteriales bacterium]